MKQHINLFNLVSQQYSSEWIRYKRIKKSALYSLIVMAIVIVAVPLASLELNQRTKKAKSEEKLLAATIINTQSKGSSLEELVQKKQLIQQFLQDDVQFTPYYRLLQSYLVTNENPQLTSFSLDNKRVTQFTVLLINAESYKRFMKKVEEGEFVNDFQELNVSAIPISETFGEEGVEVSFTGTFKEINDKKL